MPLDGTLFLQGAQMRMQDRNAALDRFQKTLQAGMDNKAAAAKAGVDFEKLAGNTIYKIQTGQEVSPQELGALQTWDAMNRTKTRSDLTGNSVPANTSIFETLGAAPQGQYQPMYPPVGGVNVDGLTVAPVSGINGPAPSNNKMAPPYPPTMSGMPANGGFVEPSLRDYGSVAQGNMARVNAPAAPFPMGMPPEAPTQSMLRINPVDSSPLAQAEAIKASTDLQKEAGLERVKENIKQEAGIKKDSQAVLLLQRARERNKKTLDAPYQDTFLTRPIMAGAATAGVVPEEANNAIDLLRQDRLDMAAPLAKELGVNPTDKDFQASLDRIYNLNSTKASRDAQIVNMINKIREKRGEAPYPEESSAAPKISQGQTATGPNGEKIQFNGKAWVPIK